MPKVTKGYQVKYTMGKDKGMSMFFTSKAKATAYAKKHAY